MENTQRILTLVIAVAFAACAEATTRDREAASQTKGSDTDGDSETLHAGDRDDTPTDDIGEKDDGAVEGDGESPASSVDELGEDDSDECQLARFPDELHCEGAPGGLGEALQKALWFFNVQKSGRLLGCPEVQWRGDAHLSDAEIELVSGDPNGVDMSEAYIEEHRDALDPDGDGTVDLSGGFYDAGDFIKFGLTTAFTASTLAWALYEFPEAFKDTGLAGEAREILRWAADYFMKCTFIEDKTLPAEEWNLAAYAHQVGDVGDHSCGWMPPELRRPDKCPRKGSFATHENPAADTTALTAAALAQVSLVMEKADPDYAGRCLDHAVALYNFAAAYPDSKGTASGGLYESEYSADDLAWAAVWLHVATGKQKYLDDVIGEGGFLFRFPGLDATCMEMLTKYPPEEGSDNGCWFESHTHCWNSLRSGVFATLAYLLEENQHEYAPILKTIARTDSMAWVEGPHSPGGFALKVSYSWGSGRYNSAGQFVALVFAKHFPEYADRIVPWARSQIDYLLGDNPLGKSYMMGYSESYADQPHHAAGHASIYGEPDVPTENRHIIWGALVNGPMPDDSHVDKRSDYGSNEVAIDYNAAFAAAIAANYAEGGEGQCPIPDFPPLEEPTDEFYTMGRVNDEYECRTQVEITMINETIHPPRFDDGLSSRYYFDVSELEASGMAPEQITADIIYDNYGDDTGAATKLEGPFPCETDSNTWYFTLSYEGQEFWGRQVWLDGPRVTIVDFGLPTGSGCVWNSSNDWSFDGLTEVSTKTNHITAYSDGELVWGEEPPCHSIEEDEPGGVVTVK